MRRRQYLTTGMGLVAASALGATVAAQDNETDDDGGEGEGGEGDGVEFSTFVQEVKAAFGDINATVVSFCDCPRISEFVVTTRGEDTNDDAFQEELRSSPRPTLRS